MEFKQPADTSIALNRINERANPSQILGELKDDGEVGTGGAVNNAGAIASVRSKIEIMGKQVRLESNAQVLAPSGDVSVTGKGLHDAAADPAPATPGSIWHQTARSTCRA